MSFIVNPYAGREGYNCFGCCQDNPIGLRLKFYEDGDKVVADWMPDRNFEGWHNILHGGIQASLLDEIGSWFVYGKIGSAGVTSRLDVKYRHPVRIDKGMIRLEAMLHEYNRRIVTVDTKLYDGEGRLCSEALASYFLFEDKAGERMPDSAKR